MSAPDAPPAGAPRARRRPTPTPSARAVTYTVVALLALAAAHRDAPGASRRLPRPPRVVVGQPVLAPEWVERTDTVHTGRSLVSLLDTRGVSRTALHDALAGRPVPAGTEVTTRGRSGDSVPSEVVVAIGADRLIRLQRDGSRWSLGEQRLPWTTDTVVIRGTVRSTLAAAFAHADSDIPRSQRAELAYALADIFEYRVDMGRDLQPGDEVRVLVERSRSPRGAVKVGRLLAARLELSGTSVAAVRYAGAGSRDEYFDDSGRSLRAHFLRAPLAFRRVSSAFGRRLHPILGVWRQHKGVDYAAAQGTPVRAIGDGVVIKAGRSGGYGNVLEVRLRNGYVTRYGHLRNFARGMRPGTRVAVGQTVAFVGTTGLSTAPHLHFEMLSGGRNLDPRVALRSLKGGEPIDRRERAAFDAVRTRLLASLEPATTAAVTAVD